MGNENKMSSDNKPVVLIADDSKVMRVAFRKILEKNYQVLLAADGEQAWSFLLENDAIQVLYSDLNMPNLNGHDLLLRIRHSDDQHIATLPVVIITGKDDVEKTKEEVLSEGANDFISKPFDRSQLLAKTKSYIKLKQTSEQLAQTTQKLEDEAAIDEVTGLLSRRYFEMASREVLSRLKRHGGQCVLMYLSIDNIEAISQKHGERVANSLLKTIAKRIANVARKEDNLARIGHAKFALILNPGNLDAAYKLADRLHNELCAIKFTIAQDSFKITNSIGLYQPALGGDIVAEKIFVETEKCLQSAIAGNGNSIVTFSEIDVAENNERQSATKPLSITSALAMLDRGEFSKINAEKEVLLLALLPLLQHIVTDEKMLQKLVALLETKGASFDETKQAVNQ